jgi:hypothetical protein
MTFPAIYNPTNCDIRDVLSSIHANSSIAAEEHCELHAIEAKM